MEKTEKKDSVKSIITDTKKILVDVQNILYDMDNILDKKINDKMKDIDDKTNAKILKNLSVKWQIGSLIAGGIIIFVGGFTYIVNFYTDVNDKTIKSNIQSAMFESNKKLDSQTKELVQMSEKLDSLESKIMQMNQELNQKLMQK